MLLLIKAQVEQKNRQHVEEVKGKFVNSKLVKNLIEKMRITGTNQWTSIADVTSTPKEVSHIEQMVTNGLLDKKDNLIRFLDSRIFGIVDSHVK